MDRVTVPELGRRARVASRAMAAASGAAKDTALGLAADLLEQHAADIVAANGRDVDEAGGAGATPTEIDRLDLKEDRIGAMADGLRQVAGRPDPVGQV
ncbi:MAG: glutamate-5-semialdehyde dehydrogenase, partial [Acidimicrobiales bacterium]